MIIDCRCVYKKPHNEIPSSNNNECELFYRYLKESWIKNDSGYYGFIGDPLTTKKAISSFNEKRNKCFVGSTRKGIYELFGNPTIEYVSNDSLARIEYFFNSNCKNKESGCMRLKFRLDPRADTVIRVLPIIKERILH
jgi:hypothetical protein